MLGNLGNKIETNDPPLGLATQGIKGATLYVDKTPSV